MPLTLNPKLIAYVCAYIEKVILAVKLTLVCFEGTV